MGLNLLNSNADPICPTYASGSFSLTTGKGTGSGEFNDDFFNGKAGAGYGYQNQIIFGRSVGATNCDWTNDCLSQSVAVTYSSGLLSFGRTGRQS